MRITNGLLQRAALRGLQTNLQALDRAQRQASTGVRFERPSEDPVSMGGVMQSTGRLRAIEQYQRNLSGGLSRLNTEDSVLGQLTNQLGRARQLGLGQVGATANPQTRDITKQEVDQIIDAVTGLGNTQLEGSYLFGGLTTDVRPFPPGGPDPLNPPLGDREIEANAGLILKTNHSGSEVFIDTGALDSLYALSAALEAGVPEDIATAVTDVETAFDNIQSLVGELGARVNRLEATQENLSALEINLQTFRSDLQDVELEEAVTEMVSRQVAYEAALAANSRILNLTLTNYLR
ncbi:MAG: flagellin [Longimicrobiales bacterium]